MTNERRDDTSIRDPKDITPESGHLEMIDPITNLVTKDARDPSWDLNNQILELHTQFG